LPRLFEPSRSKINMAVLVEMLLACGLGIFPRSTGSHRNAVPPGRNLGTPFQAQIPSGFSCLCRQARRI